jgi:hypothetical protein
MEFIHFGFEFFDAVVGRVEFAFELDAFSH